MLPPRTIAKTRLRGDNGMYQNPSRYKEESLVYCSDRGCVERLMCSRFAREDIAKGTDRGTKIQSKGRTHRDFVASCEVQNATLIEPDDRRSLTLTKSRKNVLPIQRETP